MKITNGFIKGFISGLTVGFFLIVPLIAAGLISWNESEVKPVCLVKPDLGAFVPVSGNTLGVSWDQREVVPMCEVKYHLGGFVPKSGNSLGIDWDKSKVLPVCFVQPKLGRFEPME